MPGEYVDVKKFKKVVLLYNRNSGKQLFASMMAKVNETYKLVKELVGPKNAEMRDIRFFDQIPQIAAEIVEEKVDWVIIAGGDGTIRAMIEQLANRKYVPYISVFPAGTVNLVAKELLLKADPHKWFKRVSKGIEVPVYLGRANGNVFLTVAGIGFDSLVVDKVTEKEKKLLNKLAYVWQGTEIMRKEFLFNNWRYRFQVRFDDEAEWYDATSVIVGKSRYYAGRYNLFNGASLSSPLLHAALFTGDKRGDFIRYAACIAMEALTLDNDIIIRDLQNKLTDHQKLSHELKDTPKAEILTEDHSVMLEEYRLYLENNSANRKTLQKRLEQVQESIVHKENDIKRFHIEPTEYKSTEYSANAYNDTEQQLDLAKEARSQAYEQHSQASNYHTKVKNDLEHAKKKLAELNAELLPRSEVGSDFERRIKECENKLEAAERESEECKKKLNGLNIKWIYIDRFKKYLKLDFTEYTPKISEIPQDTDNLIDTIKHCIDQLTQAEGKAKKYHSRELEPFRNTHTLFMGTLDGILSVIDDDHIKGDKYFTLYERTESDIKRYQDRIAQLAVQLKDVEDSRKQLVDHCKQRGGRLYDNLKTLSGRSVVQIGNVKKHMIQIVLPEIDPDSDQPYKRIDHFITEQVQKHLSENTTATKTHNDHLDIRRLLNCYIGNENIPINVFKIDKNIQNCRYRSWQDALKANSGGEQFVVLFSLIVSVMNYTRSLTNNLNSTSGVLILDNPFGPISSPHLLEPMFRIARHFHIQLICLTHLGTAAVTSFFDMVYQLRFKNLPLSNVEILEAEAKQHMEHAFYLSEQLSLF